MKGLPVEVREKETVKISLCSINKISITKLLRINFEHVTKLTCLVLFAMETYKFFCEVGTQSLCAYYTKFVL